MICRHWVPTKHMPQLLPPSEGAVPLAHLGIWSCRCSTHPCMPSSWVQFVNMPMCAPCRMEECCRLHKQHRHRAAHSVSVTVCADSAVLYRHSALAQAAFGKVATVTSATTSEIAGSHLREAKAWQPGCCSWAPLTHC